MAKKNVGKTNKTLYLADWLIALLDAEGDRYGGPGEVAATAILAFCRMSDADKIEAVRDYATQAVREAYSAAASHEEGEAAMAKVLDEFIVAKDLARTEFKVDRVVLPAADAVAKRLKKGGQKGRVAG